MSPPAQTAKLALKGQSTNKQTPGCLIIVLKTLRECPWAIKGQWKVFLEDKLTPTDTPPTAKTCPQTIRLLDGQLKVCTDGSATAGTKDGGTGVIVTCGDKADPTIFNRSRLRFAAFTSKFAEKDAVPPCFTSRFQKPYIQLF